MGMKVQWASMLWDFLGHDLCHPCCTLTNNGTTPAVTLKQGRPFPYSGRHGLLSMSLALSSWNFKRRQGMCAHQVQVSKLYPAMTQRQKWWHRVPKRVKDENERRKNQVDITHLNKPKISSRIFFSLASPSLYILMPSGCKGNPFIPQEQPLVVRIAHSPVTWFPPIRYPFPESYRSSLPFPFLLLNYSAL